MFRLVWALLASLTLATAAAAAPPPIEAYGKLPGVELISLSPSGDRLATVAVVGDARTLLAATTNGMQAIFTTAVGPAKVRDIQWAGEDHLLVRISQTTNIGYDFTRQNYELSAVVVINLKTGKSFTVFEHHPTVAQAVFDFYGTAQIGGTWYGFFAGMKMQQEKMGTLLADTDIDLYRVNLDTGAPELLANGNSGSSGWLVNSAGEVVAHAQYNQLSGDWSIMTGERGGRQLLGGHAAFEAIRYFGLGRTPDTVLVAHASDTGVVYDVVPLAGGAAITAPESAEIDEPLFDRTTGLWIGERLVGDVPDQRMFDAALASKTRGVRNAFPGLSVEFRSWNATQDRVIVFTSGGDDSGTYWLVDIKTRAADPIGYAYPDIKPSDVGGARMVAWTAGDSLALHGVLTLPPGREAKGLPLVVLPHGGPEMRDFAVFDWWAQAFAARGYAVFQPNFRGSDGYGQGFRDAGFGEWGRKMQTDISDGVAELARQGIIDPHRACIVGSSYGGYAALAGVTLQHGFYRCSVAVAGVSDLSDFILYQRKERAVTPTMRYWETFIGGKPGDAILGQLSPTHHAVEADAPILLIHGKDDTVVPIAQSYAMQHALQDAHKPVELVVMPGEDHWLSREDTRIQMLRAAVAFVEKYNPADAAPAASASAAAPAAAH